MTGSNWTAKQKREAFDWLQELALADGSPFHARVALDELHALASAAYPQAPVAPERPRLTLVRDGG